MKKRTIWKMFLLEIVTLGIYRLYFLIKTRREMMDLNPQIKIKSPAFIIAPIAIVIIGVIFFIATSISSFKNTTNNCFTSTSNASQSTSLDSTSTTTNCSSSSPGSFIGFMVFYFAIFVAVILFVVWEWSYSHGVEIATGNKLSFAMSLVILVIVPDGIDILIIQDYFNKLGDTPVAPIAPQAPVTPMTPPMPPTMTPPAIPTPPMPPSSPPASYLVPSLS